MRGKSNEVVETISRMKVDLCCLQETRWRKEGVRKIIGKDPYCKFYWSGNDKGTGGVGVLVAEKWLEKVFEVKRVSDRTLLVRLVVGKVVFAIVCIYATQVGLSDVEKDNFYEQLQILVANVPNTEELLVCGDWNGHIGSDSCGYEEVHGGHAIGTRNAEGERLLEFSVANNLVIGSSMFEKRPKCLVTYQSEENAIQIDYILFRRSFRRHVTNVRVILGEECPSQHNLPLCDFKVPFPRKHTHAFNPRIKLWKLKDPTIYTEYVELFASSIEDRECFENLAK